MIKLNKQLRALLGSESEPKYPIENAPLFITGCMRSGTTLLVDKLSWHPQLLKIGTELNDIWTDYGNAPIREKCIAMNASNENYQSLRQMTIYFTKFIQESKGIKRHIIRSADKLRTGKGRIFYDWEHLIPLNKSPHLTNKLDLILSLFPESKVLLIIRNPYAHSASMKFFIKNEFNKTGNIFFAPENNKDCWKITPIQQHKNLLKYPGDFKSIPLMWKRLNILALQAARKFPERVYLVSYEALISNPEYEYRNIFEFLNLESKHKEIEEKIIQNPLKFKNTFTQGSSLNKWKKQLTSNEISSVENQEQDFLQLLKSNSTINVIENKLLEYTFN